MHPRDGRVVSNFIMQALRGEPITLYGTGEQSRSFCYVDDLVEGLIRMMATEPDIIGPINLGNPHEFTMRRLAEMTLAFTGSKSPIIHLPLPEDDPRQRQPDITAARALLGWEPTIELAEGLRRAIAYFEGLLTASAEP